MKYMIGTEYITKNKDGFMVQKYIKGKMEHLFFSTSLIECLMIRDQLIENDWDKDTIPLRQSNTGEKYIYKIKGGYELKKYINNKMVHFGRYKTLNEAIIERDLLIEYDWDIEILCNAPVENTTWLNRFGKNQFQIKTKGRVDII